MSVKRLLPVITCLILLTSSIYGYDDVRKGFVFGGGMGYSPATGWRIDSGSDDMETTLAINLLWGYAWNNRNILAIDSYRGFSKDFSDDTTRITLTITISGLRSINWYHYLKDEPASLYSILGIGHADSRCRYFGDGGRLSIIAGVGYEFIKHIQVGVLVSGSLSKISDRDNRRARYYQISFMINMLAY